MSGDMNVSLRLDLDYRGRQDAKRAERDLQSIKKATQGLGHVGLSGLDGELRDVSAKAKAAGDALKTPQAELRELNGLKTDIVEGELASLKRAAIGLDGAIEKTSAEIRELNRLKTDKAEAELKALGKSAQAATKDLAKLDGTKLGKLNGAIDQSSGKLNSLRDRLNNSTAINQPAQQLTGSMNVLASTAGNAFGALLAFASVDNILRGLNQLEDGFNRVDDAATRVAVTADMRDPRVIAGIKESNAALSQRYGLQVGQVNDARNVFAAANFSIDRQEAILDPTSNAAHASGSDPAVIASAVLAAMNSLGLSEEQVPAFLDQVIQGGKEGEFEIEAMARYFPALGALYAEGGKNPLDATAELIALAQTSRKGAGTEEEAATNLSDFIGKISNPTTVKNFKEFGVSLEKVSKTAAENGQPYILAVLDEIERLTGGDKFKIGQLFGDKQAMAALRPLLSQRDFYQDAYGAIRNDSTGTVDRDSDFIAQTPAAKARRRDAAWADAGRLFGGGWSKLKNPIVEGFLGLINPDYRRTEADWAERQRLREVDVEALELDISDLKDQLASRPEPIAGHFDPGRQLLEMRLREMEDELGRARQKQGIGRETSEPGFPVPRPKPTGDLSHLAPDPVVFGKSGREAGEQFTSALEAATHKASQLADRLRAEFSFNATPTITPRFGGADAQPMSAPGSSRGPAGDQVTYNQTINQARDPARVAREVTRRQNREVRSARARALHETGAYT